LPLNFPIKFRIELGQLHRLLLYLLSFIGVKNFIRTQLEKSFCLNFHSLGLNRFSQNTLLIDRVLSVLKHDLRPSLDGRAHHLLFRIVFQRTVWLFRFLKIWVVAVRITQAPVGCSRCFFNCYLCNICKWNLPYFRLWNAVVIFNVRFAFLVNCYWAVRSLVNKTCIFLLFCFLFQVHYTLCFNPINIPPLLTIIGLPIGQQAKHWIILPVFGFLPFIFCFPQVHWMQLMLQLGHCALVVGCFNVWKLFVIFTELSRLFTLCYDVF
jgi:hypothetical protein